MPSGRIFSLYPNTVMSSIDNQKLKDIKNYKFDQNVFKQKDKQRLIDAFKAEIKFSSESQRYASSTEHKAYLQQNEGAKNQSISHKQLNVQQIEAIRHQLEGEIRNNLGGFALDGSEANTLTQIQNISEITQRYLENKGLVPNALQTYTTMSSKRDTGVRASPVIHDSLNMISKSIGRQSSLITLDKAIVHEDNQQNAVNIRRFGVARQGEFKKKHLQFPSYNNLQINSVDFGMHQDSLNEYLNLNQTENSANLNRYSPRINQDKHSPLNVSSINYGKDQDQIENNHLTVRMNPQKAESTLSNVINYKDSVFFSSTRNKLFKKSVNHIQPQTHKTINTLSDNQITQFQNLPIQLLQSAPNSTKNQQQIPKFNAKIQDPNFSKSLSNTNADPSLVVNPSPTKLLPEQFAKEPMSSIMPTVAVSPGFKDDETPILNNNGASPTLSPQYPSSRLQDNNLTAQGFPAEASDIVTISPPQLKSVDEERSGNRQAERDDRSGLTWQEPIEKKVGDSEVRVGGTTSYRKTYETVKGAQPEFQLNEMQKHLKNVRMHNLADYQKIKGERNAMMSTFRNKYAYRYKSYAMNRGGAIMKMARGQVEWEDSMHERFADLQKFEHPKTFIAANMIKNKNFKLPSVIKSQRKQIDSILPSSSTELTNRNILQRSVAFNDEHDDDDTHLINSREPDKSLEMSPTHQNPNKLKSSFRKQKLNVMTQSCDYDSNLYHLSKKKDAIIVGSGKQVRQNAKVKRQSLGQHSRNLVDDFDKEEISKNFPFKDMQRKFLINGKDVMMPIETQTSLEQKLNRVSYLAQNIHSIKQSVRDQFLLQQEKQLENYNAFQMQFKHGGVAFALGHSDQYGYKDTNHSKIHYPKNLNNESISPQQYQHEMSISGRSSYLNRTDYTAKQRSNYLNDNPVQLRQLNEGTDYDRMTEAPPITQTIQSPETFRSGSDQLSRDEHKKVLSAAMIREIQIVKETLEVIKKEKERKRNELKPVLYEKVKQMQPDYSKYKKELKEKIQAVREEFVKEIDHIFDPESHILSIKDKFNFENEFQTNQFIVPLMDIDPEFKQMIQKTHPILKFQLNSMINSVLQELKSSDHYLQEYIKKQFLKELNRSQLAENLVKMNKKIEEFEKKSLKSLVLSSIQKAQQIKMPVKSQESSRKTVFDTFHNAIKYEKVSLMLEQLQLIFKIPLSAQARASLAAKEQQKQLQIPSPIKEQKQPDETQIVNIGKKFDNIGQNIFARTDIPIKDKKQEIQARNAKLKQLTTFYGDFQQKQIFFQQAKNQKIIDHNYSSCKPLLKYFKHIRFNLDVPQACFAKPYINHNTLYLREENISDETSEALKEFLGRTTDNSEFWIEQLIIDGCTLSAIAFKNITEGLLKQGSHIKLLSYSNCVFPVENFFQIQQLLPLLKELTLSNLKSTYATNISQVTLPRAVGPLSKFYEILIDSNLLRIKLSKLNLSKDEKVISELCRFISQSRTCVYFDFSWNQLKGKHLFLIMQALNAGSPHNIRGLNLSYNTLQLEFEANDFDVKTKESSVQFIDELIKFLQQEDMEITHLDLSGMQLQRQQLIEICQQLVMLPNLSAVHFNDNGINNFGQITTIEQESELKLELLDIFGIDSTTMHENEDQEDNVQLKFHDVIEQRVREQLSSMYDPKNFMNQEEQSMVFKNKLTQQKLNKYISNQKFLYQNLNCSGVGRITDETIDRFTLTRAANHPELIFSQQKYLDSYFEKDAQQQWQLAENGNCFICNRHEYVVIMYQQGADVDDDTANQDLIEINDKTFIDGLKKSVNLNSSSILKNHETTPYIIGTLVQPSFKRKLKMVRSELFALLAISQSQSMVKTTTQMRTIKNAIMAILDGCEQNLDQYQGLNDILLGWNKIIYNIAKVNYLNDVRPVNIPDNLQQQPPKSGNSFIFAGFFPAGYHNFIIYDPLYDKVFIKDLQVHLNSYECYPEYPRMIEKVKQIIPKQNVWRKWIEDTKQTEFNVYHFDLTSGLYDPMPIIRNEQECNQLHQFFREERHIFKIFFREMIAKSQAYPRIKFEDLLNHILQSQQDLKESERIPRSFIELAFQKATQQQSGRGLRGKICRAEFFNFVVRCVVQVSSKNFFQGLMDFKDKFIMPKYIISEIPRHRKIIRASQDLNDLLLKNQESLKNIFNEFSFGEKGFTLQSANNLVQLCSKHYNQLSDTQSNINNFGIISQEVTTQCFAYSLMTVQNEQTNTWKYYKLYYVEFLEFLCRVAIKWKQKRSSQFQQQLFATRKKSYTSDGGSVVSAETLDQEIQMPDTVIEFLKILYEARNIANQQGPKQSVAVSSTPSQENDGKVSTQEIATSKALGMAQGSGMVEEFLMLSEKTQSDEEDY